MKRKRRTYICLVLLIGGLWLGFELLQKHSTSDIVKKAEEFDSFSEPPEETETFLNEYYVNYPDVKNMVKYLNVSADDVKVFKETDGQLIFGYHEDPYSEAHMKYVNMLVDNGYTWKLSDGTIISAYTFNIKGSKLIIKILSDIDACKENKLDIYLSDVTDQNIICELTK